MSIAIALNRGILGESARLKMSAYCRAGMVALCALTIFWASRAFTAQSQEAIEGCGSAKDTALASTNAEASSKPGNDNSDVGETKSSGKSGSKPGGAEKKKKIDPQQQAAGDTAIKALELIKKGNPSIQDVATEALSVINDLLISNRADQKSIYLFVRTLNRNLRCIKNHPDDVEKIKVITSSLLKLSYSDQIFQNANLSNQIQTRLPLLILDSVELTEPSLSTPQFDLKFRDFREDLGLLARRIENAKRFRIGIGIGYFYLPELRYSAATKIDLTPYQLTGTGGTDSIVFNTDFSNRSMAELLLSARVPYAQIEVGIPDRTQTQTIATTVQESPATATSDLLSRTTINSKLAVVYDVTASLLLSDIATNFLPPDGEAYQFFSRLSVELGAGMTGFQIADSISTDVRIRTDQTKTFNALPSSGTITSSNKTAFESTYASAHARYYVSDEVQVGVAIRKYAHSGSAVAGISGLSAALTVIWYPTFGW